MTLHIKNLTILCMGGEMIGWPQSFILTYCLPSVRYRLRRLGEGEEWRAREEWGMRRVLGGWGKGVERGLRK